MADLETRLRDALRSAGDRLPASDDEAAWARVAQHVQPELTLEVGEPEPGLRTAAHRSRRPGLLVAAVAAALLLVTVATARREPGALVVGADPTLPRYLIDPPAGVSLYALTDPVDAEPFAEYVVGLRSRDDDPTDLAVQAQRELPKDLSRLGAESVTVSGRAGWLMASTAGPADGGIASARIWWQDGETVLFAMAFGPRASDRALLLTLAESVTVDRSPGTGAVRGLALGAVPDGFELTFDGPARLLSPTGYTLDYTGVVNGEVADPTIGVRLDRGGLSAAERARLYRLDPIDLDGRPAYVGLPGFWVLPGRDEPESTMVVIDLGDGVTATVTGSQLPADEVRRVAATLHPVSDRTWSRTARALGTSEPPAPSGQTTSSAPPTSG